MNRFLIGCGTFALVLFGVVTIGGFVLWFQFVPVRQGVSDDEAMQTALAEAVPGVGELDLDLNDTKTIARITVSVPFDPNAGDHAAKVATVILHLTRTYFSYMPPKLLEIRLFRVISSGSRMALQERTFIRDLKMPLPVPGRPKL